MVTTSQIRLGVLTRAFGLDGGMRLALDGGTPPRLTLPVDAMIGYSPSFAKPIRLVRADAHGRDLICFFEGITSVSMTESLVDRALYVSDDVVAYDEPFSNPRLIGYVVKDEQGRPLGSINEIFRTPAHFVWNVRHEEREWMLPATSEFVLGIDDDERVVRVRLIPGLFDDTME
jgi:16S rRNA processing protein RimM